MLVTSVPVPGENAIANLLVAGDKALLAAHGMVENAPNGPGDLSAALFTARLLDGEDPATALETTTASVYDVLALAAGRGADELMLETDARSLSRPVTSIRVRAL